MKGKATHSIILARESHGQRSLAGYSQWGHRESDMTEQLSLSPSKIQEPVPKDMDKSVKDEEETQACMQNGFNWVLFLNWMALPVPASWIM